MLRDFTVDHLDPCVEVYVETFAAPPWDEEWTRADARQRLGDMLATPRAHGLCVVEDDTVVGFALGQLERSGPDDHFLLREMCVRPGHQRSGLGGVLLAGLTDRLPGVEHWYLLTARESPAADFYQRHGFRPAGRLGVFVRP